MLGPVAVKVFIVATIDFWTPAFFQNRNEFWYNCQPEILVQELKSSRKESDHVVQVCSVAVCRHIVVGAHLPPSKYDTLPKKTVHITMAVYATFCRPTHIGECLKCTTIDHQLESLAPPTAQVSLACIEQGQSPSARKTGAIATDDNATWH